MDLYIIPGIVLEVVRESFGRFFFLMGDIDMWRSKVSVCSRELPSIVSYIDNLNIVVNAFDNKKATASN